jgi:hypothetical protein
LTAGTFAFFQVTNKCFLQYIGGELNSIKIDDGAHFNEIGGLNCRSGIKVSQKMDELFAKL